MAARATRSARRAAVSPCHLLTIFPELQLHVAGFLSDPHDCAALCLAVPRGLGLRALRELPQYKEILVSVAMQLAREIDQLEFEGLLRRYLWDKRMTDDGCVWLTAAAWKEGLRQGILKRLSDANSATTQWHLSWWAGGWEAGALVREKDAGGTIWLYEGKDGAERMVREEWSDGRVHHYEGERGAERVARVELDDGTVIHFEGERGAERQARVELDDGTVNTHFEGERGAERKVRMELDNGSVIHYEGEKRAERQVRMELDNGAVIHYEGERGAERQVRMELPSGSVIHFEGEKGAERQVRAILPDGGVVHFDADGNLTLTHDAMK